MSLHSRSIQLLAIRCWTWLRGCWPGAAPRLVAAGAAAGGIGTSGESLARTFDRADGRSTVVFRKDSRADSFQRQISALRQQLSEDQDDDTSFDQDLPSPFAPSTRPSIVTPPPSASVATSEPSAVGVIAANSDWNGTLRSQGSLQVFGRVSGELHAAEEIVVAEGAVVEAIVAAARVSVAGTIRGTVECSQRLEVLPSGHIIGDVTSPKLVVHEGATVEGDLSMRAPGSAAS